MTGLASLLAQAQTQLPERDARRDRPRSQPVPALLKRATAPAKATITRPVPNSRLAAATTQTFIYSGQIVTWTVPAGVTSLTIEARGAQGANNGNSTYPAGKGAIITGTVAVTPGQQLSILVGQQPVTSGFNDAGGGTFVVSGTNQPLIIAGGGGGGGNVDSDLKHGQAGTSGGAGAGGGGAGGTDGQGGKSVSTYGAGGGLLTDGEGNNNRVGKAFVNGGGGSGDGSAGFGGGGFGNRFNIGGGGGGYSGGGAGGTQSVYGVGGGGGSFNAGTNPSSKTGATDGNSGSGLVIISYVQTLPICYVKQDGTGDGSSWANASGDLQSMINAEGVEQVWVAGGRYQPAAGASFAMKTGVAIYGGFVGTESSLGERPSVNPISSGPSSSTLAGNGSSVIRNPQGLTNSALLDGFVITGGNATVPSSLLDYGGGIFNFNSSPTISNCLFQGNTARTGGALFNSNNSNLRLINCLFQGNTADNGGGIYNDGGNHSLTNCIFHGNTATNQRGGALFNRNNSSLSLSNCLFQGNTAGIGGGIYSQDSSEPSLTNCTLTRNRATQGAALYNSSSQATLTNTILWDNEEATDNAIVNFNNNGIIANYCLIGQGETSYSGTENKVATRSPFVSETDLRLNSCSQALNTGEPSSTTATSGATDLAGQPRIYGPRIDIGAYEYQSNPTVINLTNPTVTTATVGQYFSQSFSASGGQTPYSYTVVSGNLPDELSLSSAGLLAGTPTQSGSYSVIVQAQTEQGCTGLSAVYSLTVSYPIPTITSFGASPNPVCAGSPLTFTATVANYSGSYSYTLTNGVGTPISGSSISGAFSQSLVATGSIPQNYTLLVSSQGQQATATTSPSVNPLPQVSLTSSGTLTCAQTSVNLLATGGDQGAGYRFNGPGQFSQTGFSPTASVTNAGIYSVTVINSTGCSATATAEVTANTSAPENVTLTNNGPLSFTNASVMLTATGGEGYSYSFSQGTQQVNGNTARVTTAGVYSVTVTRQDNNCAATASTTVLGGNNPTVCRGGTAVISVAVSGAPVKYEWYKNTLTSPKLMETPQLFRGTATSSLTLINAQTNTQGNFYLKTTDQSGTVTIYGPYRLTVDASCRAREVASLETPLQVELAPNPIQQDRLRAIVRGAEGRSLQIELVDLNGKSVRQQHWQQAESGQVIDWDMQGQASGVYLLQVVIETGNGVPAQRQTMKVVKP
ncbi:hypothetical protein GCM10027341_49910 [Spirosoma knui]